MIAEHEMLSHQEASGHTGLSNQLMNHPSSKNTNVSKGNAPVRVGVSNVTVRPPDLDIKELTKLKPVLQLWSTLRLIKWQENQLSSSDVYLMTDNHTDNLVCTDMESTTVEIKQDDDLSLC